MTKGNRGKTNLSPFSLLTIWSGGKVAWQAHTTLGIKTVMYMKRTPGRESWREWSCVNYPVKMGNCPPSRVSHPWPDSKRPLLVHDISKRRFKRQYIPSPKYNHPISCRYRHNANLQP